MKRNESIATLSILVTTLAILAPAACLRVQAGPPGALYSIEPIEPPGEVESIFATDLLAAGGLLGYEAPGPFDPLAVLFAWR